MVLALSGGAGAAEFGYDNIAVSVRTQARGSAVLPKDVFDLALNGNALDRVYEAGGLDAEAQVVWRAGLSAGTALGRNVTLGVGANYLHGLLDARLVEADADFLTTPSEFVSAGGLVYRRASGGTGWAFDVGATLSQGAWRYSLGCLDLGPGIVWHQGVEQGTYSFELDSVNAYDIAKAHGFTQQFSRGGSSSYRTAWPVTVNLGLGRRFGDWLNCGLLLQGRGAGKLGLETALLSSVEFWPWAWMPLGLDLGYSSCRGMVAGVNAGLIWRGLVLSGGATNEAGLLLAARGVSYRLGIGYGTAMAERVSKPDILRIHYEGD
jgi:hypothetical protein